VSGAAAAAGERAARTEALQRGEVDDGLGEKREIEKKGKKKRKKKRKKKETRKRKPDSCLASESLWGSR